MVYTLGPKSDEISYVCLEPTDWKGQAARDVKLDSTARSLAAALGYDIGFLG